MNGLNRTAMMPRWVTQSNCYLNWPWWRKARRSRILSGLTVLPWICCKKRFKPSDSHQWTNFSRRTSAMPEETEDKTIYKVVVNHEEQYSIWPAHKENALGWKDAGKSGTKAECLAYIKEAWTDMRPLSLRK